MRYMINAVGGDCTTDKSRVLIPGVTAIPKLEIHEISILGGIIHIPQGSGLAEATAIRNLRVDGL